MSSNSGRVGVTFIWAIENFDESWTGNIESPVFLSNSLNDTEWKMSLYPLGAGNSDFIALNLTRCGYEDKGIERIIVDCELSILDNSGSPIEVMENKNHGFLRGHTWWCKNFVLQDDVFEKKRSDFLFLNILTIRCRLWRRFNENTLGEMRLSTTKIERSYFVWTIEEFCQLRPHQRKSIYLKKSHSETSILTFEFFLDSNGKAEIEISPTERKKIQSSLCISVLDIFGKHIKSEDDSHSFELRLDDWCFLRNAFRRQQVWRFPSFITKSSLVKNKHLHLPMGILSLLVECYFYTGETNSYENIHPIPIQNFQVTENLSNVQKYDKQCMTEPEINGSRMRSNTSTFEEKACGTETLMNTQKSDKQCMTEPDEKILELSNTDIFEKKVYGAKGSYVSHSHRSLTHDIQCMYEDGLLCDFILRSSNKEFHVHKNILSARSPVFRAMFTTEMREKENNLAEIPDVDSDTLQRMLLFVYSNNVEAGMTWVSAMNLYFAADKYAIDDLKQVSCSILKYGLSSSNACAVLVHADLHGDQDLKSTTKDFIIDHDKEVIGSEEWERLQKNHIQLTVEILSYLYVKKMRN